MEKKPMTDKEAFTLINQLIGMALDKKEYKDLKRLGQWSVNLLEEKN